MIESFKYVNQERIRIFLVYNIAQCMMPIVLKIYGEIEVKIRNKSQNDQFHRHFNTCIDNFVNLQLE